MDEAKEGIDDASKKKIIKKVRKRLPKSCQRICRIQNKKRPNFKLTPHQFSTHIRDLIGHHEEEIQALQRPYCFKKMYLFSN